MNAAVMKPTEVQVGAGMASDQDWVRCDDVFQMKVLSVDEARHNAEVLFKIAGGYRSGEHTHTCETHAFVVQGRIKNHTTGCTFGPGDYCYQPYGDRHDEEFLEDTVVYASYRGDSEKLVEFYGDDGELCGEFTMSDFVNGLKRP